MSVAAMFWFHEEIFQVDAGPTEEGREVVEEEGEPYFFAVLEDEEDFGLLFVEDPFLEQRFGGHHFIEHVLVFCKGFDEFEDERGIFALGEAKRAVCGHGKSLSRV